jgi:hypothetical protein
MGKKVITYCLFGNKLKYCHGIIEAVVSSNITYLGWEVRVYYSTGKQAVPESVLDILKNLNCVLIPFSELSTGGGEDIEGMFRRFTPLNETDVDYWVSRDADSRASPREKKMVDEWIESGKAIHSILDNPAHGSLMGGLFGVCNKILIEKYPDKMVNIVDHIKSVTSRPLHNTFRRGADQDWLMGHFKSITDKKDILVHLNKRADCLPRCHIAGVRPVPEHFETIMVENHPDFCGKQINYSPGNLPRPCVAIEPLNMKGTIM